MRMGSAARLHGGYLFRLSDVADVEDPDAAKTLGADRSLDTSCAAVDPATRLFDRHEQEVAVNRHVTLAAGAHHRRELPWLPGVLDVVDIEPMKIADEHLALTECEIGVRLDSGCWRRAAAARVCPLARVRARVRRTASSSSRVCSGGDARPAGAFGSKNPSGFGRLAISSMLRAAIPASRKPALRPMRGSLDAGAPAPGAISGNPSRQHNAGDRETSRCS